MFECVGSLGRFAQGTERVTAKRRARRFDQGELPVIDLFDKLSMLAEPELNLRREGRASCRIRAIVHGTRKLALCSVGIAELQQQRGQHHASFGIRRLLLQHVTQIDGGSAKVTLRHLVLRALDSSLRRHEAITSGERQKYGQCAGRDEALKNGVH